ncbi:MAG: undecaprenyl diphosphate synthase family protein, partial [Spirochaetales bacterium]|nr:undecaprenyl diphosphate synthase family protein [Spirochaetales bacterium]
MHLGLIMDGNGRWATQRSLPRAAGHLEGLKASKRVVLAAIKL